MKKKLLFFYLILTLFLLVGCVQGTGHVTINQDGSMDFSIHVEMSQSSQFVLMDQVEELISNTLENSGFEFQVVELAGDGREYQIHRHFESFEELNVQVDTNSEGIRIEEEHKFFYTKYRVEGIVDVDQYITQFLHDKGMGRLADNFLTDMLTKRILQEVDFEFMLTLPIKAFGEHNAKEESDNTLTWDISLTEPNPIEFELIVPNVINIVIACVVTLIMIVLLVLLARKQARRRVRG